MHRWMDACQINHSSFASTHKCGGNRRKVQPQELHSSLREHNALQLGGGFVQSLASSTAVDYASYRPTFVNGRKCRNMRALPKKEIRTPFESKGKQQNFASFAGSWILDFSVDECYMYGFFLRFVHFCVTAARSSSRQKPIELFASFPSAVSRVEWQKARVI